MKPWWIWAVLRQLEGSRPSAGREAWGPAGGAALCRATAPLGLSLSSLGRCSFYPSPFPVAAETHGSQPGLEASSGGRSLRSGVHRAGGPGKELWADVQTLPAAGGGGDLGSPPPAVASLQPLSLTRSSPHVCVHVTLLIRLPVTGSESSQIQGDLS